MIQFDLPKEQSSIIKVIGVGGGGSNAVNYMHSLDIGGVDFIVCNTDAQALAQSRVPNKIQLGPSLTQGLGAGANPEIGRQATEESLEEIKRILEVNTKMAFVTAGMGGGTGTGGAPIIAKICKDMGILTVGIVTTPFSYEGKKRALHADAGIQQLKSQVDTLLVISNDKLRHQFGNLTMSAALSTADNVLATAAKCITDVINTTGQINVDFADVCTVMRNGGVAILGSARAQGESRAQLAIEQALNSPLLNDNDIKGAKWVLININSRAGESEFTMDEVETIQQYLLAQAGQDADVILGLGYDDSLGDEISITIIATGFEQKSPFGDPKPIAKQEVKDEKIMFTLDVNPQPKPESISLVTPVEEPQPEPIAQIEEPITAAIEEELPVQSTVLELHIEEPVMVSLPEEEIIEEEKPIVFELTIDQPDIVEETVQDVVQEHESIPAISFQLEQESQEVDTTVPSGFLTKPSIIYVTEQEVAVQPTVVEETVEFKTEVIEEPVISEELTQPIVSFTAEAGKVDEMEEAEDAFELVFHEEAPTAAQPELPTIENKIVAEPAPFDEAEAQRARSEERLYKLRNLSFNFNASDPNNEYENIPAYVRHNLQVHNTTLASVEKFYSSYSVNTDENNVAQISTINTFLEGKKPD